MHRIRGLAPAQPTRVEAHVPGPIDGLGHGIGASALSTAVAQAAGATVHLVDVGGAARRLGPSRAPDRAVLVRLACVGWDLLVRLVPLLVRLRRGRWAVVGAGHP